MFFICWNIWFFLWRIHQFAMRQWFLIFFSSLTWFYDIIYCDVTIKIDHSCVFWIVALIAALVICMLNRANLTTKYITFFLLDGKTMLFIFIFLPLFIQLACLWKWSIYVRWCHWSIVDDDIENWLHLA